MPAVRRGENAEAGQIFGGARRNNFIVIRENRNAASVSRNAARFTHKPEQLNVRRRDAQVFDRVSRAYAVCRFCRCQARIFGMIFQNGASARDRIAQACAQAKRTRNQQHPIQRRALVFNQPQETAHRMADEDQPFMERTQFTNRFMNEILPIRCASGSKIPNGTAVPRKKDAGIIDLHV